MRKMKFSLLYIATIIILFSCTKNKSQEKPASDAAEFLTDGPWLLLSYGYDNNKNGEVDSNEENIRECEKDNTYTFKKDGSGIVNENALICDGNEQAGRFNWALTDNDSILDFYSGTANIVKLSEQRLYITNTGTDPIKLMVVYGR
ncbi:MAG: lipocalin family protein [Bacteroidota bacterium]